MEKEPEKAEGEAEPVSGLASDLTYEEARALSAPVSGSACGSEEPPAVPEAN